MTDNATFQEMTEAKRWVVCDPKSKIPLYISYRYDGEVDFRRGSSTDSTTWCSYEEACEAIDKSGRPLILGFVLGGGWCGLDLDHVNSSCDKNIESLEDPDAMTMVAITYENSYAEWSPSGDGIHCILKAKKSEKHNCRKKLGRNQYGQPMVAEFYGNGRFFTVTREPLKVEDGFFRSEMKTPQDAVDNLGMKYFKPGRPVQSFVPVVGGSAWGGSQVDKYVSTIIQNTSVSEGSRNSEMFSIAGNIAKKVNYCPNETLKHCKAVNASCFSPPLPEYELFQVVQSSINNGTRRVDTPWENPYIVEEFSPPTGIIERLNNLSDNLTKSSLEQSEFESIPGFIGEYIKRVKEDQVGYQPELALAGALSCMSAIVGGRIECEGTVPSIMAVGLAPSGGGKDFARALTADILHRSDNGSRNGPEHLSSGEGLVSTLATSGPSLFQLDEAGELFSEVGQKTNPVAQRTAKFLKEAYSKAGKPWKPNARADASNNIEIEYPYASLYFTTTSQRWWNSFPAEGVADGLLGRCLIFEAPGYAEVSDKDYKPPKASDKLLKLADAWVDPEKMLDEKLNNWSPVQWSLSPEASDMIRKYMNKIAKIAHDDEHGGSESDAIWMRSRDRICKVALLIAASQKGPSGDCIVDDWHMELAIDIVKATNYRVLHRLDTELASTEEQKIKLKIIKALEKNGMLKKGSMYRKGVRCDAKMRDQALKALVEEGEIEHRADGMFKRVSGKPRAI
jgi:hypothetical protein